jgi:hypothetical protein
MGRLSTVDLLVLAGFNLHITVDFTIYFIGAVVKRSTGERPTDKRSTATKG